jgi:hypothetical protein
VQHKKDNLDRQSSTHWCCFVYPGCLFHVALVLFCLSRLSFYAALVLFRLSRLSYLFCTGTVLSIQVVFFMLPVQHKKTTWIDKTAPVQHKKDNLDRQNSTSAK